VLRTLAEATPITGAGPPGGWVRPFRLQKARQIGATVTPPRMSYRLRWWAVAKTKSATLRKPRDWGTI